MTVYVDDLRCWNGKLAYASCHLFADTDAELEAFARSIDVPPLWKHKEHYDLSPSKRKSAVAAGAVSITCRQMTRKINRRNRRYPGGWGCRWSL